MERLVKKQTAFSTTELLVTILILVVIVGIAVPGFSSLSKAKRLYKGSESLINRIRYYHSEAIRSNSNVYISFQTGSSWCYGISSTGSCNCNTANSCLYNSVSTVFTNGDYPDTSLSVTGLSTASSISYIQLNGTRGTVSSVGTVTLGYSGGSSVTISVNKMGRVSACGTSMNEYTAC